MKREQKWEALQASIREMTTTPGSSVALCHQQGKTAVYLADDGSLVEVPPGGTRDESMPRSDAATRIEIGAEEGRALLIIIGANGAGKTTLGRAHRRWLPQPYYNVDVIADGLGDADDPILQREARALVDKRIEYLRVGETFGFESTYSGRSRPEIVRRAKDTGYRTCAVFVGTAAHRLNVARVRRRAREGGHDVPESEIVRRWPAPWRNLLETWSAIDEIEVIDSSGQAPRRVATKQATLVQIRGALPKWAAGLAERADA